ncbi:MAG: FAD-dependent oxidoreductase, partial [Holophagae bacterium]
MVVGSVSRGCQVVVIGAGPGGYVAAIRLAQLGKDVILVEKAPALGGVCLNVGCIPSKALIHASDLAHEVQHAGGLGLTVEGLSVDLPKMVSWKDGIVERLTSGVAYLCKQNGVDVVHGEAHFLSDRSLEIEFEQAVIATGSRPMELPSIPFDGAKVIGSTEALSLPEVPGKLVVIGGGYIGLELGSVYAKLGSEVTVVEFLPSLLPDLDPEVGKALTRRLKKLKVKLLVKHRAESFEAGEPSTVVVKGPKDEEVRLEADVVLMSVGRVPNTESLALQAA